MFRFFYFLFEGSGYFTFHMSKDSKSIAKALSALNILL